MVKRDAELKLQKITHHYEERLQQWNEKAAVALPIAAPPPQKRDLKVQDLQKVKLKKVNGEKVLKATKKAKHSCTWDSRNSCIYNQASVVSGP